MKILTDAKELIRVKIEEGVYKKVYKTAYVKVSTKKDVRVYTTIKEFSKKKEATSISSHTI